MHYHTIIIAFEFGMLTLFRWLMQWSTHDGRTKFLKWHRKATPLWSGCWYKICGWCLCGWCIIHIEPYAFRGKTKIVLSWQMIWQRTFTQASRHRSTRMKRHRLTRPYTKRTSMFETRDEKQIPNPLLMCTFASTFISIFALAERWSEIEYYAFYYWSECQARRIEWTELFPKAHFKCKENSSGMSQVKTIMSELQYMWNGWEIFGELLLPPPTKWMCFAVPPDFGSVRILIFVCRIYWKTAKFAFACVVCRSDFSHFHHLNEVFDIANNSIYNRCNSQSMLLVLNLL